jgi:DNA-binding NtrC family response regulator
MLRFRIAPNGVRGGHTQYAGMELLDEIKERFPGVPVMMMTAYGDDDRLRG